MIIQFIKRFFQIFGNIENKIDPLDELLIEKGKDPDKIMEDFEAKRNEEGESNVMNRIMKRIEKNREYAEKMKRQANSNL